MINNTRRRKSYLKEEDMPDQFFFGWIHGKDQDEEAAEFRRHHSDLFTRNAGLSGLGNKSRWKNKK